jgi:hypothetical protein
MVRLRKSFPCFHPSNEAERLLKPVVVRRGRTRQGWEHHTPSPVHVQSRGVWSWPDWADSTWSHSSPGRRRDRSGPGHRGDVSTVYVRQECTFLGAIEDALGSCGFLVSSPVRDFGSSLMACRNASEDCHNASAIEVTVLATQAALEGLAERIERAYRLRCSGWYRGCSTARVWSTAAAILVQLHQEDPSLPLDPELYVAVQPVLAPGTGFDDPWVRLTQASSARCYRRRVREMIRRLRTELRGEVRFAERRVGRGEAITKVLLSPHQRISPLGCYIAAVRADRIDLAERLRHEAVRQYRSCPLYRAASRQLLAPEFHPVRERSTDEELVAMTRHLSPQVHLN